MLKDLIMQGLIALVQIVVLIALGALIDFLAKKIGNENVKKYYDLVKKGVQAAEQVYGAGQGEEKKAWVLEYLSKALGKKLSADDLNMLLESAVHEMNLVLKNKGLETAKTANIPTITVNASNNASVEDIAGKVAEVLNSALTPDPTSGISPTPDTSTDKTSAATDVAATMQQ